MIHHLLLHIRYFFVSISARPVKKLFSSVIFTLSIISFVACAEEEIPYSYEWYIGSLKGKTPTAVCKAAEAWYTPYTYSHNIVSTNGFGADCYFNHPNTGQKVYLVAASMSVTCPAGTTIINQAQVSTIRCVVNDPLIVLKDKNNGPGCPSTKNPINVAVGNKWQVETDIPSSTIIGIDRTYNSNDSEDTRMGTGWSFNYSRSVYSYGTSVSLRRPDGKQLYFIRKSGVWTKAPDVTGNLTQFKDTAGVTTGWAYLDLKTNLTENFDASGRLVSITDNLSGMSESISYFSNNFKVSDQLGRILTFNHNANGRINSIANLAGYLITFNYDTNNNLSSVTYPDGKVKTYLYENTTYKNALTGIVDENTSRFSTYAYDTNGRAISSEHAGAVQKETVSYQVDASGHPIRSIVTSPLLANATTDLSTTLGVVKSSTQSQPAGSGCAASAAAYTYDANGNVASKTDFNGNKITYVYDLTRNLETSRTEGLTSAGAAIAGVTRTITTAWHATWRLPTLVEEYAGATATGTPVKRTSYTYDTKGNLTQLTETDPVRSIDRTTTITYTYSSAVPGLILTKVVDGPRTDVSDITTYTYYPHDATCAASTGVSTVTNLGCRGQLQSITNALGQTTQYTRYNHHGQVEEMTDSNGLVTTNTYDLRQRLLTRTVGNETTSFTYDGVGQITLMTMPDSSTLAYTYDAAHRLTKVTDGLGNHVDYTLDAEGNRIEEKTYDPSGNLAKTLTRSYDALNRLQTLTGVAQE